MKEAINIILIFSLHSDSCVQILLLVWDPDYCTATATVTATVTATSTATATDLEGHLSNEVPLFETGRHRVTNS